MICPTCDGVVGLTCYNPDECFIEAENKKILKKKIEDIEYIIACLQVRVWTNKKHLELIKKELNG